VLNVLFANIDDDFIPFFPPSIQVSFKFGGSLFFAVAEGGGFFKILGFDCRRFFGTDGFDLRRGGFELRRTHTGGDAATGSCLVHHIDSFVWEIATRDIAFA
jgi:hypothetical protein